MWTRTTSAALLFAAAAFAGELSEAGITLPAAAPVLRGFEPNDSGVVTLPGMPTPPPREPLKDFTPPPPPPLPEAKLPAPPAASLAVARTAKLPSSIDEPRPILRRAPKPFMPPDFEHDSAAYCQKRIGEWTQPDVYNLFGKPLRHRNAPGDGKDSGGLIYAFSDPTNRYREIEFDFAADTGLLRSVFVYPWQMTWQDARKLWTGEVSSTPANKGRTFYSFLNRHLDVLVDPEGNVISLGLY